jgi:hypothetical protein
MDETYECWAQSYGALLSVPYGTRSEDVIRTKPFEDYVRSYVDSWLYLSKMAVLPVENMEDLILVTGCTLTTWWAVAAFDGSTARGEDATAISLTARKSNYGKSDYGGAQFVWHGMRGRVLHNHKLSVCSPAYFFLVVNLKTFRHTSILKDSRISASSSGASEQSVAALGSG